MTITIHFTNCILWLFVGLFDVWGYWCDVGFRRHRPRIVYKVIKATYLVVTLILMPLCCIWIVLLLRINIVSFCSDELWIVELLCCYSCSSSCSSFFFCFVFFLFLFLLFLFILLFFFPLLLVVFVHLVLLPFLFFLLSFTLFLFF